MNQRKFAAAQDWLRPIFNFVKPGFKGYNERFQGFSAAKSWLMKNALKAVDGEVIIDPAMVKISSGSLPLPEDIAITFEEPNLCRFTWKPSAPAVHELEQAMVLVYNAERGLSSGRVYGNYRSEGEHIVPVQMLDEGATVHCYLAFLATDRSDQSDSVYLGTFEFEKTTDKVIPRPRNLWISATATAKPR